MEDSEDAKVVLVTGSSSGIGSATVQLFAKRGFKVAVAGRNRAQVDEVVRRCNDISPHRFKALAAVADLSDPDKGEIVVRETVRHFGRLDVLVNNVGIGGASNAADKSSFDIYKRVMTINVDSVIKTTMEAIPHLEASSGNIVFVSSVASVRPKANGYAYRMSKAAISSYAKCLAIDVAPKIRVNIVSPGPTRTPIFERNGISEDQLRDYVAPTILLGRLGESDEIANTIYFLASDEASFVNGSEFFVDGGLNPKPTTQK